MLRASLAFTFVLGMSNVAFALTVKNISTGIDDANAKLANNASDTDYVIASGGTGGQIGVVPIARSTPVPGTYLTDTASANSRWIVMNTGVGIEGFDVSPGTYIFQTTVDLTGFDPATAVIPSSRYAADNQLINITINSASVFSQSPASVNEFTAFHDLPANLGQNLFHSGTNILQFTVFNAGTNITDAAFRLEASITASPTPEPASLFLLAPILGALLKKSPRHR